MASSQTFIFGAGGHANVIASLLERSVIFIVPEVLGPDQISETAFFKEIERNRRSSIYIGVGSNSVRKRIAQRLADFDVKPAACVAQNAFVARDAHIAEGVVICPGSVINSKAVVGANVIVNTLSSVDHDCEIGEFTQVTAGVTFGGTVKVGSNCFFGVKCAVVPNVTIGDNVVVMAGTVITRSFGSSVMIGDYPSRVMKQL